MTRDEIIKTLHYHGTYSNDVKKRLRKLLKKYHPDKNKKDKKTILLLYQIKTELENGVLDYNSDDNDLSNYSKTEFNIEKKIHLYFLESMIQKLKKEKEEIHRKLNRLYQRLNQIIEDRNKKEEDLEKYLFKIEELEREIKELSSIDSLDRLMIIMIVSFLILFIVIPKLILLFIVFVLLIMEFYYFYLKRDELHKKERILEIRKNKSNTIQKEYDDIQIRFQKLEKREKELKKEEQKVKNELQFYYYEISKVNDKKLVEEKEKENSSYIKR